MLLTALTKSTDNDIKALPYITSAYQINDTTCNYQFTVKIKRVALTKGTSGYIQPLMIIYDPLLKLHLPAVYGLQLMKVLIVHD